MPVPEVEGLVGRWRRDWDPSAAVGVPAHITVLYPWLDAGEIDEETLAEAAELFCRHEAFGFELTEVRRFVPDVVYLAPEPEEPFRSMTAAVVAQWPDHPPYEGVHADVIPHLTVVQAGDATRVDALAAEVAVGTEMALPVAARCDAVALLVERDGWWREEARFPLGARTPGGP